MAQPSHSLSEPDRAGLYRAILGRRDCRRFRPDPIPPDVLSRILHAAHHAPSVGFMQPWTFLIIQDRETRRRVKQAFEAANARAARQFEGGRRDQYTRLKLEGIVESALNLCVTCDRSRFGPVVLGRTCQPEMDLYSTVCAVENLWLAARAEGIGVGWVSIIEPAELRRILGLAGPVEPVAYLCLGAVDSFAPVPELQAAGWLPKLALSQVVCYDRWAGEPPAAWQDFHRNLDQERLDF